MLGNVIVYDCCTPSPSCIELRARVVHLPSGGEVVQVDQQTSEEVGFCCVYSPGT